MIARTVQTLAVLASLAHVTAQTGNPTPACSGRTTKKVEVATIAEAPYSNDAECEWLIQPVSGATSVLFHFTLFDLETNIDYIYFYSGSVLSKTLTGKYLPADFSIPLGADGTVLVKFVSDVSVVGAGFSFDYSTDLVNAVHEPCYSHANVGGNAFYTKEFDTDAGVISDGDGKYASSVSCQWLIKPKVAADSIVLSFKSIALEENADYIRIYSGDSAAGTPLYELTGAEIPEGRDLTVALGESGAVYVQFTSDGAVNREGFVLSFLAERTAVPVAPQSASVCSMGATETDREGIITDGTAEFQEYKGNLKCSWLIDPVMTGLEEIVLTFNRFEVENRYDFLYVYDHGEAKASNLVSAQTGVRNAAAMQPIRANGPLLLVFETDDSIGQRGFSVMYTVQRKSDGSSATSAAAPLATPQCPQSCSATMYEYGSGYDVYCPPTAHSAPSQITTTVMGASAVVGSGTMEPEQAAFRRHWYLRANKGCNIVVQMSSMSLHEGKDFLTIKDKRPCDQGRDLMIMTGSCSITDEQQQYLSRPQFCQRTFTSSHGEIYLELAIDASGYDAKSWMFDLSVSSSCAVKPPVVGHHSVVGGNAASKFAETAHAEDTGTSGSDHPVSVIAVAASAAVVTLALAAVVGMMVYRRRQKTAVRQEWANRQQAAATPVSEEPQKITPFVPAKSLSVEDDPATTAVQTVWIAADEPIANE